VITIKIPAPSSMLIVNVLGVLGLIGLAIAVGGLTGNWWWTLAAASVEAVFLSVVASTHVDVAAPAETPATDLASRRMAV
jgi:hypothetical protein